MGFTISQLKDAWPALADQVFDGLQIVMAEEIASQYYPHLDPARSVLVLGLAEPSLARRTQEALLRAYPAQHPLTLVRRAGRSTLTLAQLDQAPGLSASVALLVEPAPARSSYEALQDIVAHLRAPEGCPWDRELTWAKLRSSLLEEAYELLAALDAEDAAKVKEELGDLLLQIAMQVQIATEEGRFQFGDVAAGIIEKLIRRHPHVFGDARVSGTEEVLANWEAIKAAERRSNGEKRSPLSSIPKGLPALAQADAYLDRMSRLRKAEAPVAPWAALAALPPDTSLTAEALGDALFGLVAWAQARGVDAESALRSANARFATEIDLA